MSQAQHAYNSPSLHADPVSISYQTEAINQLLAQKDCPSECRPLIDYLIGIAEGNTDWIEKSDAEVGACARPRKEMPSRAAAQKWVQRTRKILMDWQKKENLALIEVSPGGKDSETGETFKSRYKLNILKLAEETVGQAQNLSQWHREPLRAVELAAEVVIEDTPQTRAEKPRFRSPRRDDDSILRRNPKTALTLLKEVRNILERKGEDVEEFWQSFYEQAENIMLGAEEVSPEANGKITPIEARRKLAEQRKAPPVVHTLIEEESMDTGGHTPPPPVSTLSGGVDRFVHPPTPEEEQFRLDAWQSLEARLRAADLPEVEVGEGMDKCVHPLPGNKGPDARRLRWTEPKLGRRPTARNSAQSAGLDRSGAGAGGSQGKGNPLSERSDLRPEGQQASENAVRREHPDPSLITQTSTASVKVVSAGANPLSVGV